MRTSSGTPSWSCNASWAWMVSPAFSVSIGLETVISQPRKNVNQSQRTASGSFRRCGTSHKQAIPRKVRSVRISPTVWATGL